MILAKESSADKMTRQRQEDVGRRKALLPTIRVVKVIPPIVRRYMSFGL